MIKLKQNSILGVKLFLAFLASLMLCISNRGSTSALTFQSTNDIQFTFNPSLNITLSSSDLIIDNLTPSSSSDSNIITVSVATNAGFGYYMSATAGTSSGNTNLTSTTSGNVFTNLSSNVATLASFPDNNWGYSYSTDNGSTWISGSQGSTVSGYNGLPLDNDDSGATGVILANTDSFSNSGSIKFKIGAKASASQATGTYTNVVNFYAVANPEPTPAPSSCVAGKICYNINAVTGAEGTMGRQNASDGATVSLIASNFSRQGYGFAGWSDTYDYSGNIYGPQEVITVPEGTTANGLSLYAVWVPSVGYLQDTAKVNQVCQNLTAASNPYDFNTHTTLASVSALTDQRDNQIYAIAKLFDGRCWMIENLRLDNSAVLTLANTNNPLNDGTNVTLKHNYADSQTYNTLSPTSSVAYDENTAPDGWCYTDSIPCYDQSRLRTDNTANRATYSPSDAVTNNANIYSYGNYYNWYSATAGRGLFSTTSGTTVGDICPFGWGLPTGGSNSDYGNVFYYYDEEAIMKQVVRRFPNNIVYAGQAGSGFDSRGSNARYWTSTANSEGNAFSFVSVSSGGAYLGNYDSKKSNGMTARCIFGNS